MALTELWRLRLNLFVMTFLAFINALLTNAMAPSLHQYVTNSREAGKNGTLSSGYEVCDHYSINTSIIEKSKINRAIIMIIYNVTSDKGY